MDCTISVWALGTWSHLRSVLVSKHVPNAQGCHCLAVSGSMLLWVGNFRDEVSGYLVVLDAETLTCQHTLRLDHYVGSLLCVRGEVWCRLGNEGVVVWGRVEQGEGSGTSEAGRA